MIPITDRDKFPGEDRIEDKEEELFFDGEKYYTKEEFFNPPKEEGPQNPKKSYRWLKITVAFLITIALLSNVLSLWPQLFNLASVEFLSISRELSQDEEVQLYKESVVIVRTEDSKGTGFYISEDGHVMTNQHVIDGGIQITVTFQEGDTYRAEVVVSDEDIDIAILELQSMEEDYPVLPFTQHWDSGMSAYIIGNPLFFNHIANRGTIHDLVPVSSRDKPMLMLDAPIYQGNSGSPVINEDGQVVGVVFATTRMDHDGENKKVGLAVPTEYFHEYLQEEIE